MKLRGLAIVASGNGGRFVNLAKIAARIIALEGVVTTRAIYATPTVTVVGFMKILSLFKIVAKMDGGGITAPTCDGARYTRRKFQGGKDCLWHSKGRTRDVWAICFLYFSIIIDGRTNFGSPSLPIRGISCAQPVTLFYFLQDEDALLAALYIKENR